MRMLLGVVAAVALVSGCFPRLVSVPPKTVPMRSDATTAAMATQLARMGYTLQLVNESIGIVNTDWRNFTIAGSFEGRDRWQLTRDAHGWLGQHAVECKQADIYERDASWRPCLVFPDATEDNDRLMQRIAEERNAALEVLVSANGAQQ